MTTPEIHSLLAKRWSPRKFEDRPVPADDLCALFEAARWAPSSFNEQPWAFIVGTRDRPEAWEAVLDALVPGNRKWASGAPVLFLTFAKEHFDKNDNPNRHAFHDVGQAVAHLTVQASALDLVVHQMAGIDRERIYETFDVPEGWVPVTGVAVGYPAVEMPEDRSRKEIDTMVFTGDWGEPPAWLDE